MKAVFLDRDGVIIVDKNYQYKTEDLEFIPGSPNAIKQLNDAAYKVILISNQSGVARGYFTEDDLKKFNKHLAEELEKRGAKLDAVYYCPHHKEGKIEEFAKECGCRKPKPGMLLKASQEHEIDLSSSWMVGNEPKDIEAGKAAGCKTISTGSEKGEADFIAKDLNEAVKIILEG